MYHPREIGLASMGVEAKLMEQGPRDGIHPNGIDEGGGDSGIFGDPLPCLGCGIGWFSFIVGFVFPPIWYYAGFLYLVNHNNNHRKDLRERAGLAASAIAALICSVALLIFLAIFVYWNLGQRGVE